MNISLKPLISILFAFSAMNALAEVETLKLPPDTSKLLKSDLPGYEIAVTKCNICHSSDYINYQPPGMSLKQWTAEMHKMHYSYGAPINDDEIKIIAAYLAVTYGSAKADDPDVAATTALAKQIADSQKSNVDVNSLLAQNACLGCHALDHKVVGPAYSDVAKKYAGNPNAVELVTKSIMNGGSGKWGNVAMPPMSGLTKEQATALANFVLQQ